MQPAVDMPAQQFEIYRLRNAFVAASVDDALVVRYHRVRGDGQNGQVAEMRLPANPSR
jgi:hypothetical protein